MKLIKYNFTHNWIHRARRMSFALGLMLLDFSPVAVMAGEETAADASAAIARHRIAAHSKNDRVGGSGTASPAGGSSNSWMFGMTVVALGLAVVGGVSIASRRFGFAAAGATGPLRVIARTHLSPKHSVYLLRAGESVWLIGTGPQGAPSLLGELESAPSEAGNVPGAANANPRTEASHRSNSAGLGAAFVGLARSLVAREGA
jgi:hypothetical protein